MRTCFTPSGTPVLPPKIKRVAVALLQTHLVSGFRKDGRQSAGV